MSTTASASLQLGATGDLVVNPQTFAGVSNATSPWNSSLVSLINGNTSIAVPTTATRVSFLGKPPTNMVPITLKGVNGDTGTPLGLVDWDSFSLPTPPPANIVLAATGAVTLRVHFQ